MDKQTALEAVLEVMDAGHDGHITQDTLDYFRGIPMDDKHIIKLAQEDGETVGACVLTVHPEGRGLLRSVCVVSPDCRRQGIATRLSKEAIQVAREMGVDFGAAIASDNGPAVGLMDKIGYQIRGTEKAWRKRGEFTRNLYGNIAYRAEGTKLNRELDENYVAPEPVEGAGIQYEGGVF